MDLYVKEYSWMWQRLGLSLAECRIYGYIYGLTTSNRTEQKGYKGSERALAEKLGVSLGKTNDTLHMLIERGLIEKKDDIYTSVQSVNESVQSVNESVQSVNKNVQSVNKNVQSVNTSDESVSTSDESVSTSDESFSKSDESVNSPVPPIKEINKEMERNNNIARETLATQDPKPFDLFNEFLSAYGAVRKERSGHPYVPIGSYVNVARDFWDNLPPVAQRLLIRDIKSGKWYKERIDWVISDYKIPEPTNYNGRSFPMGAQMVIAIYNDAGGVYTKADAELYGMTIKKELES